MINVCLNYNSRIIGNRKETLDESSGYHILPLPFIDEISDERLLYVLKKMPKAYLEVFNLNIIDGYRHDEIAALLNISTTTSRKRLSRARTWIKKTMPEKEITNSTQTAQKNINNES